MTSLDDYEQRTDDEKKPVESRKRTNGQQKRQELS